MAPRSRTESPLQAAEIVLAAEEELRRHGPRRFTVVAVAERLGVSHAALYRHFPNKVAILGAITERWLETVMPAARAIADRDDLAPASALRSWLEELRLRKLERIDADPSLFAMYGEIAGDVVPIVRQHVEDLLGMLTKIVERGVECGVFEIDGDSAGIAKAIWDATAPFHNPKLLAVGRPGPEELDRVVDLLLRGLEPRG